MAQNFPVKCTVCGKSFLASSAEDAVYRNCPSCESVDTLMPVVRQSYGNRETDVMSPITEERIAAFLRYAVVSSVSLAIGVGLGLWLAAIADKSTERCLTTEPQRHEEDVASPTDVSKVFTQSPSSDQSSEDVTKMLAESWQA
ncbi:MAG: hypothetical protein R3E01_22495 [Pirellulaceae bacterium]|nr:hypothetical protein [Planctomycetales bacterium]